MTRIVIETLIKTAVVLGGLMTAAAYLVLLERRLAAWVQDRVGPNRVGIPLTKMRLFGLGQPVADGVKFLFKEDLVPAHVDKVLYVLSPLVIFVAALAVFAVIPFGSVLPHIAWLKGGPINLVIAPGMDVGMIYVFAAGSIAVYGVLLGSWASNDKYSFLGGMRSAAQLISYEIPIGLGLLGVVLMSGSLRLDEIIGEQAASGVWNVFSQPLGFVVFFVASFAEAERLPFDLSEAEQELVGGYHTEYSGIKLMMYLVAEYMHMIAAAFLIAILFLGGWHFWGLTGSGAAVGWPHAILRVVVLLAKVFAVILFFMLSRWSWPRFRFDQLMGVAWKVMLPWGMVNIVLVAFAVAGSNPLRLPEWGLSAILGWPALLLMWFLTSWINPTRSDNRPVRGPAEMLSPAADAGGSESSSTVAGTLQP
ncbi:MAG: NADH-quinone oxidoreductase subunit NuoH [Thermoguttaceae bacterium]|jgi:NADH-quinone oxidoreductase subunit H